MMPIEASFLFAIYDKINMFEEDYITWEIIYTVQVLILQVEKVPQLLFSYMQTEFLLFV